MLCRHCGTEIADKAIVCYRCGTATTDPVRKPVEIRRRRSPLPAIVIVLVLLILAFFLARRYGLIGLELPLLDGPPAADGILIDFPSVHA